NFAAGMSGGVAYVYDADGTFEQLVNKGMVSLEDELDDKDRAMLQRLVENHAEYTDSERAQELLDDWTTEVENFTKVMPDAYAEVIAERARDDVRTELPRSAREATGARDASPGVVSDD
ncbi:MAG: hypothetical protein ABEH78_00985, partial [Haloferacaceae archaeon]